MDNEIFRRERLMESCEGDTELAVEVVSDFLASTPSVLSRLQRAVAAVNCIDARLEAHSIKGSAQTLGAERLAEESLRLESGAKAGDLSGAPERVTAICREFDHLCTALGEFQRAA